MRIVVLSGAGVSRESGLETFRDAGGLWEGYDPMDVATPEALARDPALVHRFYDERRRGVKAVQPNAAHRALAALEAHHQVDIVTQNIDDLHERAGSTRVLHLHGEILKARPVSGGEPIPWHDDLPPGELRPHVVFFGESVPAMESADALVRECDLLMVVGTSLQVYPAAGLAVTALRLGKRVVLVDPRPPESLPQGIEVVALPATEGVAQVAARLASSPL